MKEKAVLIKKSQVENLFANSDKDILLVEEAFRYLNEGNIMMPDKISQIFDETSQNRINCMPATIYDEGVCGVKWVSVFPTNQKIGLRNVTGLVILSSLENGFPLAVMDGTAVTDIRTAAVGAVGAKYLSRENSETIGFIGAGRQARNHLDAIKKVRPNLKTCCVSSRSEETVCDFIKEESPKHPEVTFINCGNSYEKAVCDADIIVTATSTQLDLLKAKWIKKGATYIHVGGFEDEFEVAKKADKIVCDKWECVKHRGQTICRMYKQGLLADEDIYADMQDIISGKKIGRETEDEFIYFNSVGLAPIDVHFSKYIYEKLKKDSQTTEFNFFE